MLHAVARVGPCEAASCLPSIVYATQAATAPRMKRSPITAWLAAARPLPSSSTATPRNAIAIPKNAPRFTRSRPRTTEVRYTPERGERVEQRRVRRGREREPVEEQPLVHRPGHQAEEEDSPERRAWRDRPALHREQADEDHARGEEPPEHERERRELVHRALGGEVGAGGDRGLHDQRGDDEAVRPSVELGSGGRAVGRRLSNHGVSRERAHFAALATFSLGSDESRSSSGRADGVAGGAERVGGVAAQPVVLGARERRAGDDRVVLLAGSARRARGRRAGRRRAGRSGPARTPARR